MTGWQYLLFELNGDGSESFIRGDVPLSGVQASKALSAPHQIRGTLKVPVRDLQLADGSPLVKRWKTTCYLQAPNGDLWVGGVLADFTIDGPELTLDIAGFTAYPKGQPFDAAINATGVDPLDVYRQLWDHLQNQPGGNLGLVIDSTTTPVRVGVAETQQATATSADGTTTTTTTVPTDTTNSDENTSFTSGSIRLNWWSTDDIGNDLDTFAKNTPFDYIERHIWNGDRIDHFLEIGYPTIGSRKADLRFVLGENVYKIPTETYADEDVITEVWVLGAGEGSARLRGVAAVHPDSSLRRVKVLDDKTLTTQGEVDQRARDELLAYQPDMPGAGVTELVVRNHGNAEFGSYDVGDEVLYSGDHDWGDIAIWVKVVKMSITPEESDDVTISVVRSDTLGA